MQTNERSNLHRMFGGLNPNSYSPREHADTLRPQVESMLRTGPIAVEACVIEPHNRGVSLCMTCSKMFSVRPSRPGATVNEVLHQHGQPAQSNFGAFVGKLFSLSEKLQSITINDRLGNSRTFGRADIPLVCEVQGGVGPLDLSPLVGIPKLLPETQYLTPAQIAARRKRSRAAVAGHQKRKKKRESTAPARKPTLAEEISGFIGIREQSDLITAAERLLGDSQGSTPRDLAYQGFLRRTIVGRSSDHLLQHENQDVAAGAQAAQREVMALASALA